ncbi:hypothetical protein [Rugosimonospora africana]|uniref:Uncharacterized protein n=1 Tax=Rugosimonospora africana TaxID=556532 RepID=A0A8J3QME5_9ACTN|nr:hypothetical protein [Rugosimonospora africana]GIH12574.1 hypothetical protein Raf01_07460 [Rugosimonospora africana]
MSATEPGGVAFRRHPLRNGSGGAVATINRVAGRPPGSGMCSCPTPLIRDRETGEWLHLATRSRCPRRLDGDR